MASDYLAEIETNFPPEPPVGSVVLGKSGVAWQSYTGGDETTYWARTPIKESTDHIGSHRYGQKWGYLLIEEAPLKLLWKGEEIA